MEEFKQEPRESPQSFSDLPIELRLKIWEFACPKGRVIRLKIDFDTSQYHVIGPFSRVPTILHICQESRGVGLERFCLGFPHLSAGTKEIYWNPRADTIYLVPTPWMSWRKLKFDNTANFDLCHVLPMVQHLALPVNGSFLDCLEKTWLQRQLQRLSNLQTLTALTESYGKWLGEGFPSAIVFSEVLDVPINYLRGCTPSKIEEMIISHLKSPTSVELPQTWSPEVAFAIISRRNFKSSGWCIPQTYTTPVFEEVADEDYEYEEEDEERVLLRTVSYFRSPRF